MNRVGPADLPLVTAFLNAHAHAVMFPLANLARYGLDSDAPRGVRLWSTVTDGHFSDVMCVTNEGMAMPFLPNKDFAAAAKCCAGRLIGIIGPMADARGLERACGLTNAARTLDHDEPQMLLDLEAITLPDGRGVLRPLSAAPEKTINAWMVDYQRNTLRTPEQQIAGRVEQSYDSYLAQDSHAVLMEHDKPLAMTGFNAQLSDIVQIGGVYTPPELRGMGYARRAVALHLAQARAVGVKRATLFSASDMAQRAYAAIGFVLIGTWTLLLFDGPQVVDV